MPGRQASGSWAAGIDTPVQRLGRIDHARHIIASAALKVGFASQASGSTPASSIRVRGKLRRPMRASSPTQRAMFES